MFRGTRLQAGTGRREGLILLGCFAVVLVLHIVGIIAVRPPAAELVTQLPAVLIVALILYGSTLIIRVLYGWMARFWNRDGAEQKNRKNDHGEGSEEI
jgi:hypothetical protein